MTRHRIGLWLATRPLHRLPDPLWSWVGAPLFRLGLAWAAITVN